MIPKCETMTVEFKSDRKRLSDADIIDAVVALANAKGGQVYIGIEDDGTVSGLDMSRGNNVTGLAAMIANKTVPPQAVRVEIVGKDKPVAMIDVPQSSGIVSTSSGRVLRRRLKADATPENVPMFPHEYASRLSDLSLLDYSAQTLSDSSTQDFDPVERDRLRNIVRMYRGETALLELTDEELDRALQFVKNNGDRDVPTLTGLLIIGRCDSIKRLLPTAGLDFQVLSGSDIRMNETLNRPLLNTFETVMEYMRAWNPEIEYEMGLFRLSIPAFDHRAIREAVVNAFAHRNYSIMHRVRIQIDDDGMTINSPGGFIEGVRLDNLLTTEPRSRNQTLADALKRIGLAERTGRGIDRIYEGSLTYGRPLPDYSSSNSENVRLFIPRAVPDKAFTEFIAESLKAHKVQLNVFSLMILYYLRNEKRSDIQRISEDTHIEKDRIRPAVERLIEAGYVEASGSGRSRTFMLSAGVYRKLGESDRYVRQTDIDKIRHPEMVIMLTKEKGAVARADVAELLHISKPQAYRLLHGMVKKGILEKAGDRRSAVYRLKAQA